MIYNYNVPNYLGQSNDLLNFIAKNQLTYLIAGCGMGKSYFTKDILMKQYRVLNVNFLNTVNEQNFKATYKEGKPEAEKLDGMTSASINVQNLSEVSDAAISNFDILVVDEIQKMYQDVSFRYCCGSKLVSNIGRFIAAGKKVVVMTGTPIDGVSYLNPYPRVEVKKNIIRAEDKYSFIFMECVTKRNVFDLVENRIRKKGEYVVILANSGRDDLKLGLEKRGLKVGMVEADEKNVPSTATKYIIDNQTLPNDVDVIIATTVLQEGINLNDLDTDNKITFITFIEDIQTPHQAIQFAGRARKQEKRLILCYNTEEDFNINYTHCLYAKLPNACTQDPINMEYEQIMSNNFNNKDDWKNLLTSYTDCKILEFNGKVFIKEAAVSKSNPTDWNVVKEVIKSNKNVTWKAKSLCEDIGYKVHQYKSNVFWIFTDDCLKCKNLIKAIEKGLFENDVNNIDEYLKVIEATSTFSYILETGGNVSQKNTVIDFLAGNIKEDRFFDVYREVMEITYTENGVNVSIDKIRSGRLKQDTRKRIDKPYELMILYIDAVKAILNKFDDLLYDKIAVAKNVNSIYDLSVIYTSMADPEDKFNKGYANQQGKSRKGIYANDKFELISDSSIKFKSLDEAFNYCKSNGLTKYNTKDSFRIHEKNIVYRKI